MTLIKNALIYNGTGSAPFRADVLLRGSRISAIGNLGKIRAEAVIDGQGSEFLPGFIDIHAASDHYGTLITDALQESFLRQGVTTIIGGHCGVSIAPANAKTLALLNRWVDARAMSVDWGGVREFFAALGKHRFGVNVGSFAGTLTLKRFTTSAKDETGKAFAQTGGDALKAGMFGVSADASLFADRKSIEAKLRALLKLLEPHRGILSLHLDDDQEGIVEHVSTVIEAGKEFSTPIIVSHLRPLLGREQFFNEAVSLISAFRTPPHIYFSTYPFETSFIPASSLIPPAFRGAHAEDLYLKKPDRIAAYCKDTLDVEPGALTIAYAPADLENLMGKTVRSFADIHEVRPAEGIARIMSLSRMRAVFSTANVNLDHVLASLRSPHALISSHAPGVSARDHRMRHDGRIFDTFPRFLNIAPHIHLSREEAVRRATGLPASLLGFSDRGILKEGNRADCVLMREGTVTHVWVSGKLAVQGETVMPQERTGRLLKREII